MKRLYFLHPVVICLFLLVCTSCNLVNPAEPIPAYLKLQEPLVFSNALESDTISENIVNTWVYSDGEALGVFNRTETIPIIGAGQKTIICLAGVFENGVSAYRIIYPFYSADTTIATLTPNGDVIINPQYHYLEGVDIVLEDYFDQAGSVFEPLPTSTALLQLETGANVFQGAGSARATLTDSTSVFEYRTINSYNLSPDNGPIYLEMDYKTDATIQIGLYQESTVATYYGWNITPKDHWNKIYFNFLDAVRSSGGGNYKILIKATKPIDSDTSFTYFDNVKLLHF